ncbi:hypothetical protein [Flavobacterium pectinovorum]|uniref:Uncharacterized protein n=1 Tax=Flavobacterium pectinovorum TaxID=29533 RepID=A0AB36P6H4_9FLAO|nr:hypothetical protein [Flavobacterium pectinovorum]OXB07774.1 hypothetical protein B0A72_02600 [Flavobacterium pectinovorum]SHM80091.1 hypothetical protein SAMN05444387_3226 [Flavobacterium pectinovorum]
MKLLLDLDAFAETLTEKGYDGYFHTEGCCPDNLKDSISGFLQAWENGTDAPRLPNYLHLSTYLEWNGEDKPKVDCHMRLRYENGKFDLGDTEMHIRRTDRYGQLLKQSKLTNLTASSVPTIREAIAQVSEKPNVEIAPRKRGFRM